MNGRTSSIKSYRIPDDLLQRITALASKDGISSNEWVRRSLCRAASIRTDGTVRSHHGKTRGTTGDKLTTPAGEETTAVTEASTIPVDQRCALIPYRESYSISLGDYLRLD